MIGIVIHPLELVWWDVPKNASTTLKMHFGNILGYSYKRPHSIPFERTHEVIPNYFNLAFVRNPYARLRSLFNNFGDKEHERTIYRQYGKKFWVGMTYDDFIESIISIPNPDKHFIPQSQLIPHGAHIEKMEGSLILRVMGRHNTTLNKELIKDERIYEHYKQDFDRFGYEP